MQLVLAIHPDRRQTEQIAALVGKRLAAEFLQAPSAGEGLQELGDRIPDLILTAPLLSPFDEDVIAEYLRDLGAAAAHVQTLRIPVLSIPTTSGGGLFSLRKRPRPESTPDGCDPSYFVNEIAEYLARAAEERTAAARDALRRQPPHTPRLEASPPESFDAYPTQPVDELSSNQFDASYDGTVRASEPVSTSYVEEVTFSEPESVFPNYLSRLDDVTSLPGESAFPTYQPDPAYAVAPEPARPVDHLGAAVRNESEPAAPSHDQSTPHYSVASIYQLPSVPVEPEASVDGQVSLLLDPQGLDTIEDPQPFVDSTHERLPISAAEQEQVPARASSLPESHPADLFKPVIALPTTVVAPTPIESTLPALTLAADRPAQLAVEPTTLLSPSAETLLDSATPALESVLQPDATKDEAESLESTGTRRTPSFEAALAAIRRAWVKPSRTESPAPSSLLNVGHVVARQPVSPPTAPPSPAPTVHDSAAPEVHEEISTETNKGAVVTPQESRGIETQSKAGPDVDLTHDIDALDDLGVVAASTRETEAVVPHKDEDLDLSASTALHDLEADLEAAGPPPPMREVFPANATPATVEPPAPARRKRDKHRKKADAPGPTKAQKPLPKPAGPPTRETQDEWGLYDPNRCGFAALVDKLNEVTDEKDDKSKKTSVRVVSYR